MSKLCYLYSNGSSSNLDASDIEYLKKTCIPKYMNIEIKKPIQAFFKRLFDLTVASIGLLYISPLFLVVAIAIKLESKGPVFFKQQRNGLNGKPFYMYKFRSMVSDAENQENNIRTEVMFKQENDPRITKVGKFIRKYSIDELPQLINVIKGDMSLVGPRPLLTRDLPMFKPWHYTSLAIKPGITGLWQTHGRSSIKDHDIVVALDNHYIKNWNLALDLKLMLKTIPVVISGSNAA